MLMCPDHRAVEAVVGVVRQPAIGQGFQNRVPDAPLAPAAKALVDAVPLAELFRQVAPRRTGAQHPQHAVHERPVIARWSPDAASLRRQKRDDDLPRLVAQSSANQSRLPSRGSLESRSESRVNQNLSTRPSAWKLWLCQSRISFSLPTSSCATVGKSFCHVAAILSASQPPIATTASPGLASTNGVNTRASIKPVMCGFARLCSIGTLSSLLFLQRWKLPTTSPPTITE